MNLDFSIIVEYFPLFFEGFGLTIGLSALTVIFGFFLGTPIALARMSKNKIIKFLATAYIEVIRGTPMLLQLAIFAYGIPMAFPAIRLSAFQAGVIALSLNSAAYVAEIVRSGIQSIDKGQMEAGRSLGLSNGYTMMKIIIPQAIKNILPALGNEFVTVVKESAIVSTVGIMDIMMVANTISARNFSIFEALLFAALLYFIITFSISKLIGYVEKRWKRHAIN